MLNLQIVVAAHINWDSVPHFSNKVKLARYIEEGRRNNQTNFNFVLTNVKVNNQEELNILKDEFVNSLAPALHGSLFIFDWGTGQLNYTITEYPGTRVANAYLSGNTSNLTAEEMRLYYKALEIVNVAQQKSSPIEKARYIHDEICNRVEFVNQDEEYLRTATSALLYKKANCQGYSDSFYMLCRMCNLNVIKVYGVFDGGAHAWNAIEFGDGKFYCVDVQIDDRKDEYGREYISDEYFKANYKKMKRHYDCEWSIIPNLQ